MRPGRRGVAAGLFCFLLALAGCGHHRPASGIQDPRAEALRYVPVQPALAAVVATDPDRGPGRGLKDLVQAVPAARLGLAQLDDLLRAKGIAYERDVKPLLGNDLVLAIPDGHRPGTAVAAWVVKDAARLHDDVARLVAAHRLRGAAAHRGARLYLGTRPVALPGAREALRPGALAIRGPVVVAGADLATVRQALDVRAGPARYALTPIAFEERLAPVAGDGKPLVQVIGDASRFLDRRPIAAIPFFRQLARFAAVGTVTKAGLDARVHVDSSGPTLSGADQPIASGEEVPRLPARPGLQGGLRDAAQTGRFLQHAVELVSGADPGAIEAAKRGLSLIAGVDLDRDVLGQLQDPATFVSTDLAHVTVRVSLAHPDKVRSALGRLPDVVGPLLQAAGVHGVAIDAAGPDRYAVRHNGAVVARFGVANGALVMTTDPRAADLVAAGAAAIPLEAPPDGAQGALVLRLTPGALRNALIRRLGLPPAATLALGPLGPATVSVVAHQRGLDGYLLLPVRRGSG
jgi:hypothetical protein